MNSAITRLNAKRSFPPDVASRALSWALAAHCWRCFLSSLTRDKRVNCFTRQLRRSDAAPLRDRLQPRTHSRLQPRTHSWRVTAVFRTTNRRVGDLRSGLFCESLALELKIVLVSSE
jgi:hypothetical protein